MLDAAKIARGIEICINIEREEYRDLLEKHDGAKALVRELVEKASKVGTPYYTDAWKELDDIITKASTWLEGK